MSLLNAVIVEANKVNMEELKTKQDELKPKIADLTERLRIFCWGLQNYFIETYYNFNPTKSLEQLHYKKRKASIYSMQAELQEEIECFRTRFAKVINRDNMIVNAYKELDSLMHTFNDLCTVVDGILILEAADKDYKCYKYADAVLKVNELQLKLVDIQFEGNMAIALENLTCQAENQVALSLARLSVDWSSIFTWTTKKGVDTLTYSLSVQQNDSVLLQNLLKALYVTGRINSELHGFSDMFINKLLVKIINNNCEIFTEDHIGALVFNVKIDLNDPNKPTIPTIFNNLTAVFEFLESTIGLKLEAETKFFECFGDSNREEFCNVLIENCIKKCLPSCESSYQTYKEIIVELESFNKFLVDLKYIEPDKSPLIQYIKNIDGILYKKKFEKLLSDIREQVKLSVSHGLEEVGMVADVEDKSILDLSNKEYCYNINTPLFFPRCKVSSNMKTIVAIIMRSVEESTSLSDEYGRQLALYIKDIAVMYECLVSQRFKDNLKHNPVDIALYFNNCHYLAHTLVGPPWQNILPQIQADCLNTILIDQIYDLRVVGMEKMSAYLDMARKKIEDNILQHLSPWTQQMFDAVDRTVNSVIIYLNELKEHWHDILPNRMYEHAMCSLVCVLLEKMMTLLFFDTSLMAEDLVYMLALRFQDTIVEVQKLFPGPIKLDARIKCWASFKQIPRLLTAHPLEISSLWTQNTDATRAFTCDEIRHIIKIRFPENKYIYKILKEIQ